MAKTVGAAGDGVAGCAVGVAAIVGCGVSWSSETVCGCAPSGTMATLSEVQTAARLASGAIAAETVESLEMDPRVWPVPLATVQLPSVAAHWAESPLITYTPSLAAIQ